jgi:hypothetical protein
LCLASQAAEKVERFYGISLHYVWGNKRCY